MSDEGYEQVGTWAGEPNYKCDDCEFHSLIISEMLRHRGRYHPVSPASTIIIQTDASGRPKGG